MYVKCPYTGKLNEIKESISLYNLYIIFIYT